MYILCELMQRNSKTCLTLPPTLLMGSRVPAWLPPAPLLFLPHSRLPQSPDLFALLVLG